MWPSCKGVPVLYPAHHCCARPAWLIEGLAGAICCCDSPADARHADARTGHLLHPDRPLGLRQRHNSVQRKHWRHAGARSMSSQTKEGFCPEHIGLPVCACEQCSRAGECQPRGFPRAVVQTRAELKGLVPYD